MSRLNKFIAFFIVVVFVATAYLFISVNRKKSENLTTTIVPEEQTRPKRKATDNFGYEVGKITEMKNDEVEYIRLMKGLVVYPKEERETKKIKIKNDTKIDVPCELVLDNESYLESEEEQSEKENESVKDKQTTSSAVIEDKYCEGKLEYFRKGDIVLVDEEKGKAKWIKKQ